MFDHIRRAVIWARAVNLASKGRYERSLAVLNRMPEKFRLSELSVEVFQLQLSANLHGPRPVVEAAPRILARIEREKPNDDRARYMTAYVKWFQAMAHEKLFEDGELPARGSYNIDWDGIRLESVPRLMRRMFPLPVHPKWIEPDGAKPA